MSVTVTHTTPADGTFSAAGASAWNGNHTVTVDLSHTELTDIGTRTHAELETDIAAKTSAPTITDLGSKSANFNITTPTHGALYKVTMGASVQVGFEAPTDTTKAIQFSLLILQASTYTLTIKPLSTVGVADVWSGGATLSSGKVLPNSGAGKYDLLRFEWQGSDYCVTNVILNKRAS